MQKRKIKHLLLVLFLLFGVVLVYNFQEKITGLVIDNEVNISEEKIVLSQEEALLKINNSKSIIQELDSKGFPVFYLNDLMIEINRIYEQVYYAEILRGNIIVSEEEKNSANVALRLVNWRDIEYADILSYVNEIEQRRYEIYFLSDKIEIEQRKLDEYIEENKNVISGTTIGFLEEAKISFNNDRLNETRKILEQYQLSFENDISEYSALSELRRGTQNFIQRNWMYLIGIFLLFSLVGLYLYKLNYKKNLRKKIGRMKEEKEILLDLIKKTQEERFNTNKLSGLVYKIRISKYQEKLEEINQNLPVLEKELISLTQKNKLKSEKKIIKKKSKKKN